MKRLAILICLILCACSQQSIEPVRILPPDITLNPYTAQTVAPDPIHFNNLRSLGDERVYHFKALPNEALSLQVFTPFHQLEEVRLALLDITAEVKCYRIGLTKNTEKSNSFYPDVLIPLQPDTSLFEGIVLDSIEVTYSIFPYSTSDSSFPVPKGTQLDGVWLEVLIPAEATTGTFIGELIVETSTTSKLLQLSVEVIEDTSNSIPFQLDMNEYGYKYHRAAPKDTLPEQRNRLDRRAHQFARDHYAVLNPLPYRSQRGIPYQTAIPTLLNNDLLNPQLDWRAFDERFGPLFDGSAFPDGQPLRHAYLPFNPEWPAPLILHFSDRQKYEAVWQAFADAYITHFKERGWTNTVFQIYNNQKPGENNRIPWNLDEPKSIEDYRALNYYQQLTERVFANAGPVDIRFRLDISHFFCDEHLGYEDRDLRTNNGMPLLQDISIWAIAGHSLGDSLADQNAQTLLEAGKEVWLYGQTPYLHTPAHKVFALAFRVAEKNLTGLMFWKSLARAPYLNGGFDHIFYVQKRSNSTGIDFYPTLRLKQLKRAIDDLRQAAIEQKVSVSELRQIFEGGIRTNIRQATSSWR
ncbi:MAG: hypothetical protein ACRBF0_00045 [Calditrichia bacterium]